MKVIVWNMAHRAGGWEWLAQQDADLALLNEADHRPEVAGLWPSQGVHGEGWRSAVLTDLPVEAVVSATPAYRGHAKATVPVFDAFLPRPGAVAAARVALSPEVHVIAVAAYGSLGEMADTSMHRVICDLADVLDDPSMPPFVLFGGDFNVTTQWSGGEWHYAERDGTVLSRLRALGLVDCVDVALGAHRPPEGCPCELDECRHVRTRRDPRNPEVPWQNDYLFASPALAERLRTVVVAASDEVFALSDHAPIVAVFEI